jgi:tungstate transport system substrate-binding protein
LRAILAASVLLIAALPQGPARASSLTVATTTSVEDAGLLAFVLPKFESRNGIKVQVLSRPSSAALAAAERGQADVVIVNDSAALDRFSGAGKVVRRHRLMYNDFVIVGPISDPARVSGTKDAPAALRAIAQKRAPFISRGDDSGTYSAERRLWAIAQVDPKSRSGDWYREAGMGMGATVEMALRANAYVLTDRATWLAHRGRSHAVHVEGDPRLFDQYEIAVVNAAAATQAEVANSFVDWLLSADGQEAISAFTIDGHQAFFPNAGLQH